MTIRLLFLTFIAPAVLAQDNMTATNPESGWSIHFQQTTIGQKALPFRSPYEGTNSLSPRDSLRYSVTATLFLGARLWGGAEMYVNPELGGGSGISSTLGVAGFPNGETYRIGDPAPVVEIARLFVRQSFNLGGAGDTTAIEDGLNQVSGALPAHRLTITAGKFSIVDIFDDNRYSHDARTQFMNWALMSAGAWDFPADTRGYTWGLALEYIRPEWSIRVSSVMVPREANGMPMDPHINEAHSETIELEIPYTLAALPGTLRLEGFHTLAHMGNYREAIDDTMYHLDITRTRAYGRSKSGLTLNLEQPLTKSAGLFMRAGWNDGKNETWAFTEIDRSLSAGVLIDGPFAARPQDSFGAAIVLNGLSADHEEYLSRGGYGFLIGDGKLNYGLETITELFYGWHATTFLALSADYQFVVNPAYNRDRGPVHVMGFRVHVEL